MAGYQANLEALNSHLDAVESVLVSCYGVYDTKSLGSKTVKNGVMVATAKRVIQFGRRLSGFNLETFPLQKITAIEVSKGFMGKRIVIRMSGNESEVKWITQGDPDGLVALVREKMAASFASPDADTAPSPVSASVDIPDQLRKLSELRDSRSISEDEFASKKQDLLSRM
jgi:hypothetical protein